LPILYFSYDLKTYDRATVAYDFKKMKTIADLKKGERGIIVNFTDDELSLKLLEMGCLPGTQVTMTHIAPFGDPIAVKVSGYVLSLRKDEAATIVIA
jgi:ferrous iron transport protein A